MSGPYNHGGPGGYPQQPQYGGDYNNSNSYPSQPQYGQGYDSQNFGPPQRQDSFGPPQHGGFQQGIQGHQYGNYNASNPQGHSDYYGQQPQYGQQQPTYGGQPQYDNNQYQHQQQSQQYGDQQQHQYGGQQHGGQQNDAYAANQAYQQQLGQGGAPTGAQPGVSEHQFAKQSTDQNAPNYDPNAPPMTESDRGLLGALGGGFAGHYFGKKNDHGILGTLGGALVGSFAEDFMKKKKNSSSGGSSWGGKF